MEGSYRREPLLFLSPRMTKSPRLVTLILAFRETVVIPHYCRTRENDGCEVRQRLIAISSFGLVTINKTERTGGSFLEYLMIMPEDVCSKPI